MVLIQVFKLSFEGETLEVKYRRFCGKNETNLSKVTNMSWNLVY